MLSVKFAIALAAAFAWTICFSMTNRYPLRGLRNLGILACYVVGLVMFVTSDLKRAVSTWILFGLMGGLLYVAYDLLARIRSKDDDEKPPVSLTHILYGQLAWPIMGAEAIEYSLAELGILKTPEDARQRTDDNSA